MANAAPGRRGRLGFTAGRNGSQDVFAHYSAINSGGFRCLEENQRIQLKVQEGLKGLQAANITVLSSPGPTDLPGRSAVTQS